MKAPNVNELNIEAMLTHSNVAGGVLRVVYNLENVEDYTKKNAIEDLINFLGTNGYLEEIKHYKGVE